MNFFSLLFTARYSIIFASSFFILLSPLEYSQSPRIGLKAEFYSYSLTDIRSDRTLGTDYLFYSFPSIYVIIVEKLGSTDIILKPGFLFNDHSFEGLEIGVSANQYLGKSDLFISGGVNMHFVQDGSHNASAAGAKDEIFFLLIGAGYIISNNLFVDLVFHHPLNGKYGFAKFNNVDQTLYSVPKEINYLIKLGLAVYW